MSNPGQHTLDEILSQPEAWDAALQQIQAQATPLGDFYRAGQYEAVIFTGCGSTYYLSLAAAALYQQFSGAVAYGLPASEVWLYPGSAYPANRRALLVAVSRSGETTETLRACEAFRARGGDVLTLSCYPGRAMTALGAVNLVIPSGQEKSVAQTRAFTSLYIAAEALIALWTGNDKLLEELVTLPATCRRLLDTYEGSIRQLGSGAGLDRFYFLGSGIFYGLACEFSLKMKEMSLSHSEPFHFMEFRHGPKSMINPSTLVVGLLSQTTLAYEREVLNEMNRGGARILAINESDADVRLASGVSEAARGALYLPIGQLLAFGRATSRSLDPDRPNNLEAVVRLNDSKQGRRSNRQLQVKGVQKSIRIERPQRDFDVVVVGDLNADLILSGDVMPAFGQVEKLLDDATLALGSSSAIFACGAARLGLRVAFVGKVGDDVFGHFLRRELAAHGVDAGGVILDPTEKTGLTVILSRGVDRAMLTYLGSIAALRYSDIDPALLARARHMHMGSYFMLETLRPSIPTLCDLAHAHGLTVSLDTNYDPAEQWQLGDLLGHLDVFLPNETELCAIAGVRDANAALDALSDQTPLVAVKRGARGAMARRGAEYAQTASIPVAAVDTTGAGDSFDAGFIYGYLSGQDLLWMLRMGAVCGALSTRAAGGTAVQPTRSEALEALRKAFG